jgi:myo-inositol-1(or 4)-monophosphatase
MQKNKDWSSFCVSEDIFETAISAVQAGRACLLGYLGKINNIEHKEKQGLVSEADKASEDLIRQILYEKFPEFDFLGEETDYAEGSPRPSPSITPRWILDPLDGTTNYIHQLPIFCISLALEVNKEIVLGIIDVPMLNQTFTAIKGQGAFCNGKKISVSKCSEISQAFMTTGFIADDVPVLQEQLKIFNHFVWQARAIRRPGAAAYDLAMVASGVFDVYWEKNIKPWDVAAGILLVAEAGGVCRTYSGSEYTAFDKSIIAGNPKITSIFQQQLSHVCTSSTRQ